MFFIQTSMNSEFTVKAFLNALKKGDELTAARYISKNYVHKIDFSSIINIKSYNKIISFDFEEIPKNCKKDTFILAGKLVHFYSFKEPDSYATWKIYNLQFSDTHTI
ncbi:MAG: hypothetical protein FWF50_03550 [Defluviitaleaceae bacterium]|nr:hypothetical protein [Defluviitaleaceae bacterium]